MQIQEENNLNNTCKIVNKTIWKYVNLGTKTM